MAVAIWAGRRVTTFKRLVLETYGPRCHLCGGVIDLGLHHNHAMAATVHHLIPRSILPPERWFEIDIVRPAHRTCNSSQGDRIPEGSCQIHGNGCGVSKHSRDWG